MSKLSVTLRNGRVVEYDYHKITRREWNGLFKGDTDEQAKIADVTGLSVEEILDLPLDDWQRLVRGFYDKAKDADDPKSQDSPAPSTSPSADGAS